MPYKADVMQKEQREKSPYTTIHIFREDLVRLRELMRARNISNTADGLNAILKLIKH
tara:strand:- start:437 stop:607 length:171 start_codon:yes stop_codon:yes gene_type:complete